ncbi:MULTISPECIES: hypothetical protein [Calothrix]|uniref:Lipoprotein n=2 Tax=Calothrix TaxID=1186 RepID=A0ABR8A5I8_9CYAN|nr:MULTISPECIES: hypothetical protein [Calothrix]MBD2195245.1 hypothetical protein [Calothrix parietina FACHB-288]MBD2223784.1 hypothetical protein [Calothrix anomala FACHB-343]
MFKFKWQYLYSVIFIANTVILSSCGAQVESTRDQCQRFTQVLQTVVDENQKFKQINQFDRDSLLQFIKIATKSAAAIENQPVFNDKFLVNFQKHLISLYKTYNYAGSNILKPSNTNTKGETRYSSLNILKQSLAEEKEILISFNDYCNAHGFKINNI